MPHHSTKFVLFSFIQCGKERAAFVPDTKIKFSESVQSHRRVEVQSGGDTPAIGGPAQRGGHLMDAALTVVKIYAIAIRLVGEHHRAPGVGMRFRQVVVSDIIVLKSDCITLAAQSATIARNFFPQA